MLDGASSPSTSSGSGRGHRHSGSSGSEADCSGVRTPSRWGRRCVVGLVGQAGWVAGGRHLRTAAAHASLPLPELLCRGCPLLLSPALLAPACSVASEEMPLSTVPLAAKKLDDRWGRVLALAPCLASLFMVLG